MNAYSLEEQLVLQRGEALAQLEVSSGYLLLSDYLRGEAESALRSLRDCESADPNVIQDLFRKWRELDLLIERIENFIQTAKLAALELRSEYAG